MSNQKDSIVETDWASLTLGERIKHLEIEGYLVLPNLLDAERIARLKTETERLDTFAVDYSVHQRAFRDIQFCGGAITDLIAHAPTIQFLSELFGQQVIMMTYDYARSEPGHPGISLHCDGQPWGSKIFGDEQSCPRLVRVLYYLDDLTPEVSPFKVVPRSQLSFHGEANPYLRYEEHPEQVMVPCRAGSAILINQNVFHGNYPNRGGYAREMLGIAYRPAWAGPGGDVEPWSPEDLAGVPPAVRELMGDRNARIWNYNAGNKPPDMPREAPGISPSRWEREC
tara:strand:- start:2750 stop:3598 length:849 start_codon:yes stop_codon:yes gene_type:complete